MSGVFLRGPYSIGKGNYFRFLEMKNTEDYVLEADKKKYHFLALLFFQEMTFPPSSCHHACGALATGHAPQQTFTTLKNRTGFITKQLQYAVHL